MSPLKIEHRPPGDLKPYARNARTHSKKQIAQIAASIDRFGFNNPVLVDKDGAIIAGHGRVEAAKSLGLETVPIIRLEHLTDAERRAYILADNRLAEKAGWDREILAIELQNLMADDLEFDVAITGFEMPEIDVLISELEPEPKKTDPVDRVPPLEDTAVTRLGDIWQIGSHRLICGDSTDAETYTRLLDGERAQMVFTDPPYNVPIEGHVSGLGEAQAPRVCDGLRRDEPRPSSQRFLRIGVCQPCGHQPRRCHPLHRDGLATHGRGPGRGRWRLHRTQEPLRLVEDQRRDGLALPLPA